MLHDPVRGTNGASVNLDRGENYSAGDFLTQSEAELDSPNMFTLHMTVLMVGAVTYPARID
jgi:hypothetical protein